MNPYAEIDEANSERIIIRIGFTQKDLVKQLPGSTWSHKDQAWKLPLGWSACVTLRAVFGPNLEVGPKLTAWAQERYATRIGPALALRDATQREGDPTLYPFQRAGVAFLATAERALLADEMGSGKTIQSIKALQLLHLSGKNPFPVLIVCPNSMKKTWQREADKWWPGLSFLPIGGSAGQRRKQLETPAHGYIMNWESLRGHSRLAPYGSIALKRCKECGGEDLSVTATQCHVHPRELNQLKFNTIIADECFTADVVISTPDGDRKISELQPGDQVYGYDHETSQVTVETVTDTMQRDAASIVSGWNATPNHPVYVAGEGYRPIGDLTGDDIVVNLSARESVSHVRLSDVPELFPQENVRREDLRYRSHAPEAGHRSSCKIGESATSTVPTGRLQHSADRTQKEVLLESVRRDASDRNCVQYVRQDFCQQEGHTTSSVLLSGVRGSERRQAKLEEQGFSSNNAPAAQLRVLRTGLSTGVQEGQPTFLQQELQRESDSSATWREGTSASCDAENTCESRSAAKTERVSGERSQRIQANVNRASARDRELYLAENSVWSSLDEDNSCRGSSLSSSSAALGESSIHDAGRGDSSVLSSGLVVSGGEGHRGSGWLGASQQEGVRRSSDSSPRSARVRRHEILELRDPERYERVCAEGALPVGGETRVYSLTTTSGNYFAHGVLVRNCHRAKDAKSQQTRALWAATGDAPYRFALTGTPIANAPDDLWPIMHWLDPAQFPSRTRWIDRFCEVMYNAFGAPTVIGIKPEREKEFQDIVNPMMRRMPKSLVLPFLPPIVRERREVEMSPKQAKAYKQMSEQMIAELENGDTLIAASPLVKATRLIQFSSAFAELETKTDDLGNQEVNVRLSDPSCKIDAFMDDLPDFTSKSVVVFAQSKQLINLLSDRLNKQKKPIPHGLITGDQGPDERQQHMDDFQAGKTQLILCTVQAGGTGITLTKGSIAVFLQRSWSLVDTKQAEARIHRIGSEMHESVMILDYVTTGTIEEWQIEALTKKNDNLEAIVRDKDLLKRVLTRQALADDAKVEVSK